MKVKAVLLGRLSVLVLLIAAALLAADSPAPVQPFNGKDLTGWIFVGKPENNKWLVGTAEVDPENPRKLIVKPGGSELVNLPASHRDSGDLYTAETFGDCRIELELMIPKRSNSGIYVAGVYEIQVYDSFGKDKEKIGPTDMGAVYDVAAPKVNAGKAPGQWQSCQIDYQAPRFDKEGKKMQNAKLLRVTLNGQVIHENLELTGPTAGGLRDKEAPTGPLYFQGNHGPVAYRGIRITPRTEKK